MLPDDDPNPELPPDIPPAPEDERPPPAFEAEVFDNAPDEPNKDWALATFDIARPATSVTATGATVNVLEIRRRNMFNYPTGEKGRGKSIKLPNWEVLPLFSSY